MPPTRPPSLAGSSLAIPRWLCRQWLPHLRSSPRQRLALVRSGLRRGGDDGVERDDEKASLTLGRRAGCAQWHPGQLRLTAANRKSTRM